MGWSERDLPDLDGRVVVVTGASAGLGLESTRALAAAGAHVVLATRDAAKTEAAAARVRRAVPGARLERLELDLADLANVAHAADVLAERHPKVDVLLANAGLMATPSRRTVDGFELQLGVNHLGHAAFVAATLPLVEAADAGRVVVVSSMMHVVGRLRRHDLMFDRGYDRWAAYGQSKLANLLYVRELQRRLTAAGARTVAVAAHPGYAATELQTKGPTMQGGLSAAVNAAATRTLNLLVARPAAAGAGPQLYAATAPDVRPAGFYGPRIAGAYGSPGPSWSTPRARDDDDARWLFERTEQLTGVGHDLPG
ncbi:SDR family NAD(P)-dependent oxidoreductase [Nitriliruptoraceae bacterium ZYF776]|nr:SDR family NAD(P)-dependent oxidoreductase [Profundirhabdus halotolerans]